MTPFRTSFLALAATLAGACAKPSFVVRDQLPTPPAVPASVHVTTETFEGVGGTQLYARGWHPEGEPRGVVIVMHGLRDHGDRYAPLATALVERGYAVYAFDLRGHGRSAGPRVTIGSFDDYLADFGRFVTRVTAREPGKPLFLFGHSMGGAIVTLWSEQAAHTVPIAGIVLSGPALQIDAPPILAAVIRLSALLTPNLGKLAPTNEGFSSDPAVEQAMGEDPLIYQPPGPVHTAAGLVGAMERVWAGVADLTPPILCLHGADDPLTAPAGCRALVQRAGATDKTLRIYPDQRHDLVHEPHHAEIVGDMLAWLDAHTGGPAPTFTATSPDLAVHGDAGKPSASVAIEGGLRRDRGDAPSTRGGGGLRARALFGRRVAWPVGLDAEVFGGGHLGYRAVAYPLGVALVHPAGHTLSIAIGGGVSDAGSGVGGELAVALDGEAQLGPVRLLGWGRVAWLPRSSARSRGTDLPVGDELHAGIALRLGRDHHYWSTANAGAGPYVGLTLDQAFGADVVGVALGVHLWGGS